MLQMNERWSKVIAEYLYPPKPIHAKTMCHDHSDEGPEMNVSH